MSKENDRLVIHTGIVQRVSGQQVSVLIQQNSACSSCSAAQLCNSSESQEKMIDAMNINGQILQVGDNVEIQGTVSQGLLATLLAYVVPLTLMIGVLFVLNAHAVSEAKAALWALFALIPYYLIIHLLQKRIARRLTFIVTEKK